MKALLRSTHPRSALYLWAGGISLLLAQQAGAQPITPPPGELEAPPGDPAPVEAAPEPASEEAAPAEATEEKEGSTETALDQERAKVAELERRLSALEDAEAQRAEQEEVQRLLSEEHDTDLPEAQLLKMYGFMDFGFQKAFFTDKSTVGQFFATDASTFVLGNLNVFLDAEPHEDWRGLVELRFTNLPHGVETLPDPATGAPYQRTNTQVVDYTSPSFRNQITVGSVIIERAWMQWTASDLFKARSGLFLTPFGIWNVDHGTPTLISLLLPSGIADLYFPDRQLGVELLGSVYSGSWELGYHAYVSNGRGIATQIDFTEEKAFGGRLYAASSAGIKPKFGISGYHGEAVNVEKEFVSTVPIEIAVNETVSFREWSAGADVSLDPGDFRLRAEVFIQRRTYEPLKRINYAPDGYLTSAYALAAYRLPFWGLEPYLYGEIVHYATYYSDTTILPSVGTNVHFTPRVQLKLQGLYAAFMDLSVDEDRTPSDNNAYTLASRLVMSF